MRSVQVPLDLGRAQQPLDPLRLLEALVDAETDVGREFQVHPMSDLAAQIALVAFQQLPHANDAETFRGRVADAALDALVAWREQAPAPAGS